LSARLESLTAGSHRAVARSQATLVAQRLGFRTGLFGS
jgi:hypothetical protein